MDTLIKKPIGRVTPSSPQSDLDNLARGAAELRAFLKNHRVPGMADGSPTLANPSILAQSYRLRGVVTGRDHFVQTPAKCWLLRLLDTSGKYSQILESVPLPLTLTRYVAAEAGYRHPWDWSRSHHTVVTVDFLALGHDSRWVGIDFREKRSLKRPRVQEQLIIAELALRTVKVSHAIMSRPDLRINEVRSLISNSSN